MAITTEQKRHAALLDQPLLIPPDGSISSGVDRANLLGQYFAGPVPPPPPPVYALGVRPFLRVAFANNPGDSIYLYEDITPYLRDEGTAIGTRRGRQQVTQKVNTGTSTYILDNRAMTFESLNLAGKYAGKLVAMKPVQFGYETPWLPGLLADGGFESGSITGWTGTNNVLSWADTVFGDFGPGRMVMTTNAAGSNIATSEAIPVSAAMLTRYAAASARIHKYPIVSDNFNGPNVNPGLGTTAVGGTWAFNNANTWRIVSNKAQISAGAGTWTAIIPCVADVDVRLTISTTQPGSGVVFRYASSTSWWRMRTNAGNTAWQLDRSVAGVVTTMATGGPTPANGDIARVVTVGTSIKGYVGTTLVFNITDAANRYAVGCGMVNINTGASPVFDDFTATPMSYLRPRGYTIGINYYSDTGGTVPNGSVVAFAANEPHMVDSFDGTDTTNVNGRLPDVGDLAWLMIGGAIGITGNQAYTSSGGGLMVIPLDSDGDLSVTQTVIQTTHGVCFRFLDEFNYWHCEYNSGVGHYNVYKHVNGVSTLHSTSAGAAPANGDVLTIQMRGQTFSVLINGINQLNVTDPWCMNATWGGLWGSATGVGRWENFTFGIEAERAAVVDTSVIPVGTQSMRVVITIVSAVGNVDSVQAVAVDTVLTPAIAQMDVQFTGFSDGWDCQWDVGDNLCTLTASDALKALGLAGLNTTLYGDYLRTLNGTGPSRWYRLGETTLTQVATLSLAFKEEISGLRDASVARTPIGSGATAPYRGRGPLAGVAGCSPVDPDLGFSLVGPSSQDGGAIDLGVNFAPTSQKWTIGMWLRSTNGIVPQVADGRTGTGDAVCLMALNQPTIFSGFGFKNASLWVNHFGQVSAQTWSSYVTDAARKGSGQASLWANTVSSDNGGQNIVADTLWHRVWMLYDGSNNTLAVYVDGLLDHVELQFSGTTGFTGLSSGSGEWYWRRLGSYYAAGAELVNAGYPPFFEVDEPMTFDGVLLSAGVITDDYIHGKLAYPIQRSDERVGAVLDNATWPVAKRIIDTNQGITVTAQTAAIARGNPVSYVQTVEDTEQGFFFIDTLGNVRFVTHASLVDATTIYNVAQYIFGNGVGEIPYESLMTSNNDKLLYDIGEATTETGSLQTYAIAAAKTQFLPRTISKTGLMLDSNQKAYEQAQWLATLFSVQGTRLNSIVINPSSTESSLQAVQGIELGMAVECRIRPPGITAGTYFSVVAQIQGVNNDVKRKRQRVTIAVDDTYVVRWAQFGDNFGLYDMAL